MTETVLNAFLDISEGTANSSALLAVRTVSVIRN